MMARPPSPTTLRVLLLADGGRTPHQIAEELGRGVKAIHTLIARARRRRERLAGKAAPSAPSPAATVPRRCQTCLGQSVGVTTCPHCRAPMPLIVGAS